LNIPILTNIQPAHHLPASRPLRHRHPFAQVLEGASRAGSIELLGIHATRRIDITVLLLEAVNC